MPFSVIAVLLLVVSSASAALLYSIDAQRDAARVPQEKLHEMARAMDAAVDDVVRISYSCALDSVRGIARLEPSALQDRFTTLLNASLVRTYPAFNGDLCTSVTHNISLLLLQASLQEATGLQGVGTGPWHGSSVPAYLVLRGNCSLAVTCASGRITRTVELDQDVLVPLPLLAYKLDRFRSAASPMGEVESIVRYELSVLAQDRVLRGYGSWEKTGEKSTEMIITPEDVTRAVNLAVLLTELRYFHDMGAVEDDLETVAQALSGLEGDIDPADLFLLSYREGDLDLAAMVGQALYAKADAIVLKWMDYLGLIDLVNLAETALEMGEDNLFGLIDLITGGDHDQVVMKDYIASAMADAGYQEYDYRWYCYGGGDIMVRLPAYRITVYDNNGNEVRMDLKGTYALDLPPLDILSLPAWSDIRKSYRSESFAIAEAMRSYVEMVATGIASHCHLPPLDLSLAPSDGLTYLEEIREQLNEAFKDGSGWIRPAIEKANEVRTVREGLAQAAMDFIHRNWMEILQVNRSLAAVAWDLSGVLVEEKLGSMPNFSDEKLRTARNSTYMSLTGDNWGAWDEMISELRKSRIDPLLGKLDHALSMRTVSSVDLISLVADAMTSTTSLGLVTALATKDAMDHFGKGLAAQGGEVSVPVARGGIVLDLADGHRRTETISVRSVGFDLAEDGRPGSLRASVRLPWQYDRANTSYPNRHVTDLMGMTATPYVTQWGISYSGSIDITLHAGDDVGIPCSEAIPIQGSFNIVAFSGWSLEGVEYTPTSTLRGDIEKLITGLYDMIVSAAEAVGGLSDQVFLLLYRLIPDLFSCSTDVLGCLQEVLSAGTASIESIMTGLLSKAIEKLADAASTVMGGSTVDLHVLGLCLSVVIAPRDSALTGTEDRVRIDISRSAAGARFSSSLRVLRLQDGEHTIAVSMSLEAEDWSVDLTFDPLVKIYGHQVEMRGYMGRYVVEMCAPEVQRVQKVSVSLSDVPGLGKALRSIPSPLPGTKWHVDAGMEMSFNILGREGLLINEVELNPKGPDRSREWVEIYNPSSSAIDLTGYQLVSSRGVQHSEFLSGRIEAHGHFVHQFTGQALDNGDVRNFPLQESVALLDRNGKRIDAAPWLKDLHDDERTWQRTYDGSPQWELREGTRGSSNGPVLLGELDVTGLLNIIMTSFRESFEEQMAGPLDMNILKDIVAGALQKMEGSMLESVERTISVLRFYLELGLDDITGAAGGSVTMGLEYDGKAVRDCMEWFIKAIWAVMDDPLNPLAAGARAPMPTRTLADHAFVQMGAYLKVQTPDLILGVVEAKLSVLGTIRISLGTLSVVPGGSTMVDFGLVASGMVGEKVRLGVGQSASACYDVWLLKGSLRAA
jgi:hypothetical protein